MKCNSGDSGIHIEMVPDCGGSSEGATSSSSCGGGGGCSVTPSTVAPTTNCSSRSCSAGSAASASSCSSSTCHRGNYHQDDPIGQTQVASKRERQRQSCDIQADLRRQLTQPNPLPASSTSVRRTRSDLGCARPLNSTTHQHLQLRRQMALSQAPLSPPHRRYQTNTAATGGNGRYHESSSQVVLRRLRRSLSQPLDMDKLASSPTPPSFLVHLDVKGSSTDIRPGETNYSEDELDHHRSHYTSDSETMSDSESSMASLTEHGRKYLDSGDSLDKKIMVLAEAVFDHVAIEPEELAFRSGDLIEVLETGNREWWWGSSGGRNGWFPAHFVRLRVNQEDTVEDCLAAMTNNGCGTPGPGVHHRLSSSCSRRTSVSLLSNDEVRQNVLDELVNTERDFVKVLEDICEGYIRECRKRSDMFSEELIRTIFVNLEDILDFQRDFLADLEACGDNVGMCFLKHHEGFKMYSDYCNSHPMATAQLMELYQSNSYSKFFEACRLLRGLMEIPLDGYLLTPVQRICKYPLQLAELLKYTRGEHEDYESIKKSLDAMRGVAVLINERKRKMESLEKLAAWQMRVEGWEGEDLIDHSSQLIYQSEVVRVNTGMWTNNIMLFLFDHQIICCKKNIFKRHTYVYKGRICLDACEVIDVPDGKDIYLGCTVRHAIRLINSNENVADSSSTMNESVLFCCRSSGDKQRWLRALLEERGLVALEAADDHDLGMAPAARRLAQAAAAVKACQRLGERTGKNRRPTRKPRARRSLKHSSGYTGSALQLSSNTNSLGKKVGGWFSFGTNKKTRHQHPDIS